MKTHLIVWLRRDLRLYDNPALHHAAASGAPFALVYVCQKDEMGAATRWWLHHSLEAFAKHAPIHLLEGAPQDVLPSFAKSLGASKVYWNALYEPEHIAQEASVHANLGQCGVESQAFKDALLFEPTQIANKKGQPYRVFTPFYKACLAQEALIGPTLPKANVSRAMRLEAGVPLPALGLLPYIKWDRGFYDTWQVGEDATHARIQAFIKRGLAGYDGARDYPAIDGTSLLSAPLHFGEVSPRTLWHMLSPHAGAKGVLRQLIWREFAAHLLYYNPDLRTAPLQSAFANFAWAPDTRLLQAWQQGRTGYPIVDAGMRQLWQTGWMHNRVRMIVGSFLVKHLLQPWQAGERWFWDTLVDADHANNAMGWQWIAGCGADAAPYFRVFNPILQGQKFDPNGLYIKRYVPELGNMPTKFIHTPWLGDLRADYPAPIIEHAAGRARALEAYARLKAK